jgi:hypothetical protein
MTQKLRSSSDLLSSVSRMRGVGTLNRPSSNAAIRISLRIFQCSVSG